jgi:broad specificity phosphatase PhoE
MTRFLLIRHAATESSGNIAGRTAGGGLAEAGREQAARLTPKLAQENIASLYSSPQQRALETALALADAMGKEVQLAPELDEINYGDWTGHMIDELQRLPLWHEYNTIRSCTRIPHGEFMLEAQARIVGLMERLRQQHWKESIALMSHADVIRAALVYYLGLPLDMMLRLEISPASVSIVDIEKYGPVIRCINNTEPLCQ